MRQEKKYAHKIVVGKHEGKVLLGKPRCDNIKTDLKNKLEDVDWIHLSQDR
jgi:uncharacterized C2H2 Zn-finger protein